MKNRIIIIGILAVSCIVLFTVIFTHVDMKKLSADSGFDSSWDSGSDWGGSDWGSSDWGSSSYDYSWGSSSSDYSSSGGSIDFGVLLFVIIIVLVFSIISRAGRSSNSSSSSYTNVSFMENKDAIDKILKDIPGFNKEEFYDYVFNNFVGIQEAWMNFDYDALRKLVTDELFNTYKSQLKTLALKKQKNIMTDFSKSAIAITNYIKTAKKYTIVVKLTARFYDYLVDQDEKLLRGTNKRRIIITYYLTYVGSVGDKENKCPNCNAPLDYESSSNICPYCKSTIVSNTHNFLLSKKESIDQRME